MTDPYELRQAVCDTITKRFPDLLTVTPYAGEINDTVLQTLSFNSPACFVSLSGMTLDNSEDQEACLADMLLTAYVVTVPQETLKTPSALDITSRLISFLQYNQYNLNNTGYPVTIKSEQLTNTSTSDIWAIEWSQKIKWDRSKWDDVPEFLPDTIFASYHPYGEVDGTEHEVFPND